MPIAVVRKIEKTILAATPLFPLEAKLSGRVLFRALHGERGLSAGGPIMRNLRIPRTAGTRMRTARPARRVPAAKADAGST
jgi:hypothetical protein